MIAFIRHQISAYKLIDLEFWTDLVLILFVIFYLYQSNNLIDLYEFGGSRKKPFYSYLP